MRSYPHNSPEAAARIVALVVISDGQACPAELERLKELGAERELGLDPNLLPHLVHTLQEELLSLGVDARSPMGQVDDATLAALMAEISDPVLQRKVLRLSLAAARADGQLADGEAVVVAAARQYWQLVDGMESIAPGPKRRQAPWSVLAQLTKHTGAVRATVTKGTRTALKPAL